jgi:hypothetical protein
MCLETARGSFSKKLTAAHLEPAGTSLGRMLRLAETKSLACRTEPASHARDAPTLKGSVAASEKPDRLFCVVPECADAERTLEPKLLT